MELMEYETNLLPGEMKKTASLDSFKLKIYTLCKTYLPNLGYLQSRTLLVVAILYLFDIK